MKPLHYKTADRAAYLLYALYIALMAAIRVLL